jgi:hypothetical protein
VAFFLQVGCRSRSAAEDQRSVVPEWPAEVRGNLLKNFSTLILLDCLAVASFCAACNPWHLPGLKRIAKQQDERITRETVEAIKKSPALQELDHLCTKQIPLPAGFVLLNMSRDFNRETFLDYGYRSNTDYKSVKRFYSEYFSQQGWRVASEKGSGWGPPYVEYMKDRFKVKVYDMGTGDGVNYAIVCKKSDPGEDQSLP